MTEGRQFLQLVLQKLQRRMEETVRTLAEGEREIGQMHEYYWDNYTEMDQYGYENFDNQQALLNQVNTNSRQLDYRQRLRRMLDSPFFARVDFRYEGEETAETFYIGIGNFAERAGAFPLIFDWRAPVASLFYDYDRGPASYEAPGGIMRGEIASRWQYKIRNGRMIYEVESDIKIDDEILMAELGANGDVRLKNIIRTIQREQNAIIRNTKDRILIVQGAAGSGKTSIALHRIAYLLYHDRKNLKSSNILILSPNGIFGDYISHILPELGEENIREMSLDLFAYRELREAVSDCEDKYDRTERLLAGIPDAFEEKQSEEFLNRMEGYLLELEDKLMTFGDVKYRGYVFASGRIIRLFYETFTETPLLARMDAVREYLQDEYETVRGRDLEEDEIPAFARLFESMYATRDLYAIYRRFLEQEGYPPLPDVPYAERILPYEDVYPMLYMKYRLFGGGSRAGIRHLVIDEMQDYTGLQFQILAGIFSCRMTILGDRAQTIGASMRDVTKILPRVFGRGIRVIELKKSYRNTVEIASYAAACARVEPPDLFMRHGKPVEQWSYDDAGGACEAVSRVILPADKSFETAAVLALTAAEARGAYEILKNYVPAGSLHYVDRDSTSFARGVSVMPFYLAKGLEFDQVFALRRRRMEDGLTRQAAYICATRALHELYDIRIGKAGDDSRGR